MSMKKKDLDRFEKILLDEKSKILAHLEDLSKEAEEGRGESLTGDQADIASLEISQASYQKIGKREARLLKKIDQALEKIKDKSYGLCENCGDEISVARLMARPVAQLCIDCKTEQENNERHYSSRDSEEDEFSSGAYNEPEEV